MSERSHASVWHLLSEFYARRDAGTRAKRITDITGESQQPQLERRVRPK
jgi:hypothetical protein